MLTAEYLGKSFHLKRRQLTENLDSIADLRDQDPGRPAIASAIALPTTSAASRVLVKLIVVVGLHAVTIRAAAELHAKVTQVVIKRQPTWFLTRCLWK